MKVDLEPGKYIVAVSGGVDSVVLLDVLSNMPDLELVVAHFDHGIREDSVQDRQFVETLAERYSLPFEFAEGQLGSGASEAMARTARYKYLRDVAKKHGAKAIVMAHHQDDVLETAILNILRGTNRKGLTSLRDRDDITRPLLKVSKAEIIEYAKEQGLEWREDSTNNDENYLRNYVRRKIVPRLNNRDKSILLNMLSNMRKTNREMDDILAAMLTVRTLDRRWFNSLPHDVAKEVLAGWLRRNGVNDFDRRGLERLVVTAKTGAPGRRYDVLHGISLVAGRQSLALRTAERSAKKQRPGIIRNHG